MLEASIGPLLLFQINVVDRRRLWWAFMSVSYLKHYYSFSITFSVILRSISMPTPVHVDVSVVFFA